MQASAIDHGGRIAHVRAEKDVWLRASLPDRIAVGERLPLGAVR